MAKIEVFDNIVKKAQTTEHIAREDVCEAEMAARVWMIKAKYGDALSEKDIQAYIDMEDIQVQAEIDAAEDRTKRMYKWHELDDKMRAFYEEKVIQPLRRQMLRAHVRIALDAKSKADREAFDKKLVADNLHKYIFYEDGVRIDYKDSLLDEEVERNIAFHQHQIAEDADKRMRMGGIGTLNPLIRNGKDGNLHVYCLVYAP